MNRTDKIIIIFYVFLAISYTSVILYLDNSYKRPDIPDLFPKPIDEVLLVKTIDINRQKIFDAIADVENYPIMLPQNIASVKIINKTDDVIYAEEEPYERFIKTKLLVKHTFIPYDKHVLEVVDGDAKGTTMIQTFEEINGTTQLTTEIKVKLSGPLEIFRHFSKNAIQTRMNVIIDRIVNYAIGFDSESKKTIDSLYREILRRPADVEGMNYYVPLLETGKITAEDIRKSLLDSDEYRTLLTPNESKNLEDLKDESKKTIDGLYREILRRPADEIGLQHYGSLLEQGKMTVEDIRRALLNSDEYKSMQTNK